VGLPLRAQAKEGDRERVPSLDGVRGIAILLVLLFHSLLVNEDAMPFGPVYAIAASGWSGVNLFFVLSGYLITGILLDAPRTGRGLRNFYARRALRILPLYYATLLVFFFVLPREPFPSLAWHDERQLLYWAYVQNWAIAAHGAWPETPNLNHLWSLNIEEQFYLVWPLLVFWLGRRRLLWLCAALIAGCLALRSMLFAGGTAWVAIYVMTITRLDDLAVGGAIACLARDPRGLAPLRPAALAIGGACLAYVAGAMILRGAFELSDDATVTLGFSVASLGFGCALVGAVTARPGGAVDRVLSAAPLRILGKYSYCIYVVHLPIVVSLAVPPGLGHLALFGYAAMDATAAYTVHLAVAVALSLAVAFASWHLIELPFLRLKGRFANPPPSAGDA
jgi:peptidoglycan/LPS O-acetylase OafA/YrhL